MNLRLACFLGALALLLTGCKEEPVPGLPPALAEVDVSSCVACHGRDGISPVPNYPNLAGQKYAYLLSSLRQYQNEYRPHPVMGPIVAGMDDARLQELARYYAEIDPCPK
ncbi:MAG: cytochrome c [Xanthomonadales bacterium]|nr:cytochrome c [Xanthomonadales bacterium]